MESLINMMKLGVKQLKDHNEGNGNYSKGETRDLLRIIRLESVRVSKDKDKIGYINYSSRW